MSAVDDGGRSSKGKKSDGYEGSLILVEEVSLYDEAWIMMYCVLCISFLIVFILSQSKRKIPNLYNAEAAQSFR